MGAADQSEGACSSKGRRVAVIGAGVAGLTAAHELAVRGFEVTVFEQGGGDAIGGKARSFMVEVPKQPAHKATDLTIDRLVPATSGPSTGGGHKAVRLPAEHGFRFFPGFYRYVIDSMERTPDGRGKTAADHLVSLAEATIGRSGSNGAKARRVSIPLPTQHGRPRWTAVAATLGASVAMPDLQGRQWIQFGRDSLSFAASLARVITSGEERYWGELEARSWSEYIATYRMHKESQALFGTGLTRTFVATQAEAMSARTGATILLQLLYDIGFPERHPTAGPVAADRVLDGPTSDVWLTPWRTYLETAVASSGPPAWEKHTPVAFTTSTRVVQVHVDEAGVVTGIDTDDGPKPPSDGVDEQPAPEDGAVDDGAEPNPCAPDSVHREDFDWYVLAVPAEGVMELLVRSPSLALGAPKLRGVFSLEAAWMNGVLFYLRKKVSRFPAGHVICLDSPWALTVVDQTQAWDTATAKALVRDHGFETLLSVDVSNWDAPGLYHHIPARFRQPLGTSVRKEVWRQLRDHFPDLPKETPPGVVDPGVTIGGQPLRNLIAQSASVSATHTVGDLKDMSEGDQRDLRDLVAANAASSATHRVDDLRDATEADLRASNAEPLLVNTVGSWDHRPQVDVDLRNLFIAGDYVQSSTDFASMEAANESARLAVDHICKRATCAGHIPVTGYDEVGSAVELDRHRPYESGLVEPEAPWFARPRDKARRFDERVAYPLGWKAPLWAPLAGWVIGGGVDAFKAARKRRLKGSG